MLVRISEVQLILIMDPLKIKVKRLLRSDTAM